MTEATSARSCEASVWKRRQSAAWSRTSFGLHLRRLLSRVRREGSLKVLMIAGAERCFARGGREDCNEAVEQKLYESIVSFPYPVVAAVQGDAIGAGFLFAALCDFMVCSEEARYGYTDAE